jgi:hypothetical protein
MPGSVKCADCGMLAMLHKQSGEYVAADQMLRERGEIVHHGNQYIYHAYPLCAAVAVNLRTLIGPQNDENENSFRKRVIHDERQCDSFVPWNPCFSPKEHKEMIQERERLAWQDRQMKEAREFQAEQARLADERHVEQIRVMQKHHADGQQSMRAYLIICAVAAAVAAVAAVAGVASAVAAFMKH